MTSTLIYIGDDLLDLDPSTLVTITIQSVNVGDLKSRNVSYTNQFKVPISETNARIFGYSHDEWSRSLRPYRFNSCKVSQNGVEVLEDAICILTKYENGFFTLNIYENLFDIFQFLEGKKLKDIDPIPASAWDRFAIDAARTNTSGIISALVQWGWGNQAGEVYNANFFLPCFYYHTIILEILSATGLTIEGDILTDDDFLDLVIPFPGDEYYEDTPISPTIPEFVSKGTKDEDTGTSCDPTYMGSISAGDLLFIQVINVEPTVGTINTPSGYTIVSEETFSWGTAALYYKTASGSETGTINVSRSASSGGPASYMMAQIYQYRDSSADITIDDTDANSDTSNTTITWRVLTLSNSHRSLLAFYVDYNGSSVAAPTGYDEGTASDSSSLISGVNIGVFTNEDQDTAPAVTSIGSLDGWAAWHIAIYGDNAEVQTNWNDLWPDIEVKDILRDFFVRFGIIAKQRRNVLTLKTIEEILTDRTGAVNWSTKLVRTDRPINFETKYAQDNYFDYNNQENDPELGRGHLLIDNETLDPIGTVFTSVFDTVATAGFLSIDEYKSAVMGVYEPESTDNTDIKNSPAFTVLTLRDAGVFTDPAITFNLTPRTDYKVGYFVDEDQAKDSGFQYFVDTYYPKFKFALQRNKIITKQYYLTEQDIYNYDPHKMIFDGDGYYLINKISNYIPDKITKVELLKIG